MANVRPLSTEESQYFRDLLRSGRHTALRDSESFLPMIQAVEELGRYLYGKKGNGLSSYSRDLDALARRSPNYVGQVGASDQVPFADLLENVRNARNGAVHEGASARHLTASAVELCLLLENALSQRSKHVREFMVKDPVTMQLWQPLRIARRQMLANSFSFLPFLDKHGQWRLLGDYDLVRICHLESDSKALDRSLESVIDSGVISPELGRTVQPHDLLTEVADMVEHRPVLVVAEEKPSQLLGILTAFDLL